MVNKNLTKKFITVGTDRIFQELNHSILRPDPVYWFKPTGGLWASRYYGYDENVCDWLNYIQVNPLLYKNNRIGAVFSLKENANICCVETEEDVKQLSEKYSPIYKKFFNGDFYQKNYFIDYEALSNDYDAFYVNLLKLPYRLLKENHYNGLCGEFSIWGCNTLLLFNLNCIKDYTAVKIESNLDEEHPIFYAPTFGETYEISSIIEEYQELNEIIKNRSLEMSENFDFLNYNSLVGKYKDISNSLIKIMFRDYAQEIESIANTLGFYNNADIEIAIAHNNAAQVLRMQEKQIVKKLLLK